jgi:hypothetical protein
VEGPGPSKRGGPRGATRRLDTRDGRTANGTNRSSTAKVLEKPGVKPVGKSVLGLYEGVAWHGSRVLANELQRGRRSSRVAPSMTTALEGLRHIAASHPGFDLTMWGLNHSPTTVFAQIVPRDRTFYSLRRHLGGMVDRSVYESRTTSGPGTLRCCLPAACWDRAGHNGHEVPLRPIGRTGAMAMYAPGSATRHDILKHWSP